MVEKNTKKTQYRKPTYESLKLQLGYSPLAIADRDLNDSKLLGRYKDRFVVWDFKDGKKIQFDERTGKIFNEKEVIEYINLNKYGTKTPDADYAYLDLKQKIEHSEKVGPNPIRKFLSRKMKGGGTIVEAEHQAHVNKRKEKLKELENKSSNAVVKSEEKEKVPKVPNLFKSQQLDLTEIKDPKNKQIAKELHNETEQQKKIILGNILK
tara:strand:+ start:54 stop:680 length:627 start_codon:yes stop_codon:yes gene_type:complete